MKDKITIVSGLPRSGTSMMMQILEKGGMEILTDKKREADNNNPKGYFEFERVKTLGRDNLWLSEAKNKVLKVIAQLLKHLNMDYEYKIIFMLRDIEEIMRSQQIMLGKDPDSYSDIIANAFLSEIQKVKLWAEANNNIDIKFVNYKEAMDDTKAYVNEINAFMENSLNADKMLEAIDPKLYRNKK